jgi:hypothetical protein
MLAWIYCSADVKLAYLYAGAKGCMKLHKRFIVLYRHLKHVV